MDLPAGVSVDVEVPATTANLGPGFDSFGLALDWAENVRLEVIGSGYQIDVTGEGADRLPRDESHLIMRSALFGLAELGVTAPGLRLSCHNTIPHGRGLGSSSAAIVAGLLAARGLAGRDGAGDVGPEARSWLLGHADAIEGHPDNVAAAIYGGFVIAYDGLTGITVARGRVQSDLGVAVFIPDHTVATSSARGLLPDEVPHSDAAANSGRSALLVHAMASDPTLLWDATRDWLHQDYRQRAMPESYELMKLLRGEGHAAVISGAGPSVLVIGRRADLKPLVRRTFGGFVSRSAAVGSGARVVSCDAPTLDLIDK